MKTSGRKTYGMNYGEGYLHLNEELGSQEYFKYNIHKKLIFQAWSKANQLFERQMH